MQECICSAVIPLTRRYCIDILSQDFIQLKNKFYTDNFFPNTKSVSGHTCYQIFTYGEGFFWIMPLFSKSGVGIELRAFMRHTGTRNELHFDRAADQMGLYRDFQ